MSRFFICLLSFAIICSLFRGQIIESEQSTKFLRTILTTTPSTSHISNFRDQPRSDSRADKPDTFPGFDFDNLDDVTPSQTHRRRQAYSHLLRSFIQKTRERLETIREVAKQERALARMVGQQGAADDSDSVEAENDEDADDFVAEVNQPVLVLNDDPAATDPSAPRQYYATLLSSVGLQRAIPATEGQLDRLQSQPEPSFLTTHIFNPLLNVWQRARNNFNLNYYRNGSDIGEAATAMANSDVASDLNGTIKTTVATTVAVNESENNDEEIAFNVAVADNGLNGQAASATVANAAVSLIVVGSANNANHSLPFKLNVNSERRMQTKENIEENGSNNDGISQGSHWERAALAFQNAFYKYAGVTASKQNDVDDGDNDGDDDGGVDADDGGEPATTMHEDAGVDMRLAQALPLTDIRSVEEDVAASLSLPTNELQPNKNGSKLNAIAAADGNGNVTVRTTNASVRATSTAEATTESANIQIIPSHLTMQQQPFAGNGNGSGPNAAESAGIYVLEIVGTVVGLTWGAFSQIQNWFNKN